MKIEEVVSKVFGIVAEVLGVDVATVTKETRLVEDLKTDELDMTEIVMAIEEEFEIDELTGEFTTVEDILTELVTILNKAEKIETVSEAKPDGTPIVEPPAPEVKPEEKPVE